MAGKGRDLGSGTLPLMVKEQELLREVDWYQLDIVGLTSTHSAGSGTKLLERDWSLSFSGVAPGERRWVGMWSFHLSAAVL